jgi:hypothetical protein
MPLRFYGFGLNLEMKDEHLLLIIRSSINYLKPNSILTYLSAVITTYTKP